jgi:hypothetical protein
MDLKGVQFVSDAGGQRTGVLIDLRRHRALWEDVYDVLLAESRKKEPRLGCDDVKRRLRQRRRVCVDDAKRLVDVSHVRHRREAYQ